MLHDVDRLIGWLMHPRLRVVRRWSFVVTLPVAAVVAYFYGIHQGALVIAARVALGVAVALVAWRLSGERGEAVRDLLMHPRGRAFLRAEFDVAATLPRLALARALPSPGAGATYRRGGQGLAVALGFTPAILAEGVALHLLLADVPVAAWAMSALHAYALLWLWALGLGSRAYPHRIGARTAVLRQGPWYRVTVPLEHITDAVVRRERVPGDRGLAERGEAVLLPARGRVEVWLELAEPVQVQRPLHEPLATRRLAVASDEPDHLVYALLHPTPAPSRALGVEGGLPVLGALELAGTVRDAAQPS